MEIYDQKVLRVERLSHYGRVTIRPACDVSRAFAALLGQKTLTEDNVEGIKKLGYRVLLKEGEL